MSGPESGNISADTPVVELLSDDGVLASPDTFASRYNFYLIFIFFLTNLFYQMDRVVLSVLIEPIRQELLLNDSQIGMLGFAFAIFFAIFGLFTGRLSDTRTRTKILSISIGLFSLATMMSGWVQSFVQLFLVRMGVGVGEAGSVPSKYSLIGDSFRPEHRASALSLIQAGLGVGGACGLILAGLLADNFGWRMTFMLFGAPGILLALLVAFTIKEPERGRYESAAQRDHQTPSLKKALGSLALNKTFLFITFAYSATIFALNGIGYWMPSFLIRSHNMSLSDVGLVYGSITGLAMITGLALSATLSPRLLKADRRWEMWVPGSMNFLIAVSYALMFIAKSIVVVLILTAIIYFLLGLTVGPASAAIQSTVSSRMRGVAVALVMFISALVGQGMGPWVIGIGSEVLTLSYGEESLRQTLLWTPVVLVFGGLLYVYGARSFSADQVD